MGLSSAARYVGGLGKAGRHDSILASSIIMGRGKMMQGAARGRLLNRGYRRMGLAAGGAAFVGISSGARGRTQPRSSGGGMGY